MIPVILVTGFLDGGKTTFIQSLVDDPKFLAGETVLVILCEDGEEELSFEKAKNARFRIRTAGSVSELTPDALEQWADETDASLVIIEYNGMWQLNDLFTAFPPSMGIAQETLMIDSETIFSYNQNMRQLVYDKLSSAEMVVFTRMKPGADVMPFHKLVRAVSRGSQIVYDYTDGSCAEDTIEDPLPFDVSAPVIEIGDNDYAWFYRDLCENEDSYNDKVVRFKALIARGGKLSKTTFLGGRHIMTCCAEDIRYCPLVCKWEEAASLAHESWAVVEGRIAIRFSRYYGAKGPVLRVTSVEPCEKPEQPLATFN